MRFYFYCCIMIFLLFRTLECSSSRYQIKIHFLLRLVAFAMKHGESLVVPRPRVGVKCLVRVFREKIYIMFRRRLCSKILATVVHHFRF